MKKLVAAVTVAGVLLAGGSAAWAQTGGSGGSGASGGVAQQGRRGHGVRLALQTAATTIGVSPQDLAGQVGPYGIRANCIAPETILTERNMKRIPPVQQEALLDLHPIKRLGTPEDVAHAALYLASDDAAWIAGIILDVAGGAVMI